MTQDELHEVAAAHREKCDACVHQEVTGLRKICASTRGQTLDVEVAGLACGRLQIGVWDWMTHFDCFLPRVEEVVKRTGIVKGCVGYRRNVP